MNRGKELKIFLLPSVVLLFKREKKLDFFSWFCLREREVLSIEDLHEKCNFRYYNEREKSISLSLSLILSIFKREKAKERKISHYSLSIPFIRWLKINFPPKWAKSNFQYHVIISTRVNQMHFIFLCWFAVIILIAKQND